MHSHYKLCRNEADHQLNTGPPLMARVFFRSSSLHLLRSLDAARSQRSGNRRTEELAGPGEFILTAEGRIVIIKERQPVSSR